jgi:hypothetical protein
VYAFLACNAASFLEPDISEKHCLHFEVEEKAKHETSRSKRTAKLSLPPASAGFMFGSFFDFEDRGDVPPKRRALSELHGIISQKTVRL